ncbi:TnsA-like heteromeric transposase endonuclease subunit [Streptomyces sp. SHP 1-2]|uniref:TnsA-like heteromeric transposase endonuclease subunit n=1 Tax=Streptomyces sp. SHP 1-2 TaxID=2769489 RepID=UPI002237F138|nr:TnsA-like heteromeric transposase endonuclease subunit [Streptomyces sp. SHP 1-2]
MGGFAPLDLADSNSFWAVAYMGMGTEGFEAGLPVRGFPSYRGQRNFPGLYWSATTGGHVGFESWLERDHAMLLDFTPEVTGLLSQPLWLFWQNDKGRAISHAPDYFARYDDGRGLLVDCRPLDRVDERSAAKFAVTQLACEAAGWGEDCCTDK